MEEGVEIALCWMKQRILLSPFYQVVFSFRSCPTRVARDATSSPDADGWKGAMDQEIANLKSHDVYELVPHMNGVRTLKLG